jgi:hypothetical protein
MPSYLLRNKSSPYLLHFLLSYYIFSQATTASTYSYHIFTTSATASATKLPPLPPSYDAQFLLSYHILYWITTSATELPHSLLGWHIFHWTTTSSIRAATSSTALPQLLLSYQPITSSTELQYYIFYWDNTSFNDLQLVFHTVANTSYKTARASDLLLSYCIFYCSTTSFTQLKHIL